MRDQQAMTARKATRETRRVAYTIGEVAGMTGRNRTTIWRWLKSGVLQPVPVPGGHRMVSAASLERLLRVDRAGGTARERATSNQV
jgi:predicted site-specific integrase-resolvase